MEEFFKGRAAGGLIQVVAFADEELRKEPSA
jgi:hypothetical protein